MNSSSSPYVLQRSRPSPAGHVLAVLGERLGRAKRQLLSRWHDYQARRQEARALVAINEMDAHLLRDIGAPDQLIARAVERRRASPWREVSLRLSMVLVTIAVIGAVAPPSVAEAAGPQKTDAQRQMAGVFTGEFVDGAPVYRFPTVIVAGSRRGEPARSEARVAQPRPARGTITRCPA